MKEYLRVAIYLDRMPTDRKHPHPVREFFICCELRAVPGKGELINARGEVLHVDTVTWMLEGVGHDVEIVCRLNSEYMSRMK